MISAGSFSIGTRSTPACCHGVQGAMRMPSGYPRSCSNKPVLKQFCLITSRWMERFPHLASLAEADQSEVLQAWEGLGYYSRARNLHNSARILMNQQRGEFPNSVIELEKLPGIGAYTARAIASIAFGQDEAALDGNIRRVLARYFGMKLPARSRVGEKRLWQLARDHLPRGKAGDYNQALMDLGALICLPRAPVCLRCPLNSFCFAFHNKLTDCLPNLDKRAPVPHYNVSAAVIHKGDKVLITKRPQNVLLGGMWEFPGGKQEPGETLEEALHREIMEEIGAEIIITSALDIYRHAYTHFRVTVHAYDCSLNGSEPSVVSVADMRWVKPPETLDYPMGKVDRLISRDLIACRKGT